jgi:hypothetical protein
MFTKTTIALSAALVFTAATAAEAMINPKATTSRAAFASQNVPTTVLAPNWVADYDSSGAAIFRRPTSACPLSLMQQSRC